MVQLCPRCQRANPERAVFCHFDGCLLRQGPKLGLSPRKLSVGPLRVGEQRTVQVNLLNEGQGLLQGKVTVTEGQPWLKLLDSDGDSTCAVKTGREQSVAVRTETAGLVVG